MEIFLPILSIAVSVISILVGVSNFNLRNILGHDPAFSELSNFILVEQFSYYSIFYVHYKLFNIFIRYSFININFFYVGITKYLISTISFPELINSVSRICKLSIKFDSHMLVFFPNLMLGTNSLSSTKTFKIIWNLFKLGLISSVYHQGQKLWFYM